MTTVLQYLPAILQGLVTTVIVAAVCILGCAIVSVVLGVLQISKKRFVRLLAVGTIEFFRGASALVFLFWAYFALPLVPGMPQLSPLTASILVLSIVGGAYGSEVVRGGIEAVVRGQSDACHALGLTSYQTISRVILPQALSQIVPAFGSLATDLVKWTSIVSFVGVQDVLYVANTVRSITYKTVPVFCLLAAMYWLLCLAVSYLFRGIEWVLPLNRALRAARIPSRSLSLPKTLSATP